MGMRRRGWKFVWSDWREETKENVVAQSTQAMKCVIIFTALPYMLLSLTVLYKRTWS